MFLMNGNQWDECSRQWETTGKSTVIKQLNCCLSGLPTDSKAVENNGSISNDINDSTLPSVLSDAPSSTRFTYELVYFVLHGIVRLEQAVQVLTDAITSDSSVDGQRSYILASSLADTFSIFDAETQVSEVMSSAGSLKRKTLLQLIQSCQHLVSDALLKTRLSDETLEYAGLITSRQVFQSKYIKLHLVYSFRQQKFNLLREENEGYSKLLVELISAVEPCAHTDTNFHSRRHRANCSFGRIQSLLGCFDLDANRVIDLIVDVFEERLEAFAFFLELLRLFVFGSSSHAESEVGEVRANAQQEALAQVLGHKFQHYVTDPSRTPSRLFLVAALLIQHCLITSEQLLPHLVPRENELFSEHKAYVKAYARALAGDRWKALENTSLDEMPASTTENKAATADAKSTQPKTAVAENEAADKFLTCTVSDCEVKYQQLGLLNALLRIGDIRDARALLDTIPDSTDFLLYQPRLLRTLADLFHYLIEPLYVKNGGIPERALAHHRHTELKIALDDPAGEELSDTSAAVEAPLSYSELLHLVSETQPEARQQLIIAAPIRSMQELPRFLGQVVVPFGAAIFVDLTLVLKLLRLASSAIIPAQLLQSAPSVVSDSREKSDRRKRDKEELIEPAESSNRPAARSLSIDANYQAVFNLLDECVLPALSLSTDAEGLAAVADLLWHSLLQHLTYEHRYRLYGQWKGTGYSSFSMLQVRKRAITDRARYIMKRLTKENVKPCGRQLAKLTHTNPAIVLSFVITQVEKYDNLVQPVIDSLRYMSALAFDVLAYCLVETLADPIRQPSKLEELNLAPWLQSLATLAGGLARRYSWDVIGMLQYLLNHLKSGQSTDLVVLGELIEKMTGIDVTDELTEDQVEALCGGHILQHEFGSFQLQQSATSSSATPPGGGAPAAASVSSGGMAQQNRAALKRSILKLKEALLDGEMLVPFIVLLTQQRDLMLFGERMRVPRASELLHLKLIGRLYDKCHNTLLQCVSFAHEHVGIDELQRSGRLPSLDQLVQGYSLAPDVAFHLLRPSFAHQLALSSDDAKKSDKKSKNDQSNSTTARYSEASQKLIQSLSGAVQPLFNSKIWDDMPVCFYVSFWTLSINDVYVPTNVYEKQIASLKQQLQAISNASGAFADQSDKQRRKAKENTSALIERLENEQKRQNEHVAAVLQRLRAEKDEWVQLPATQRQQPGNALERGRLQTEFITQLMQYCFFPRVCFSAVDALFAARFLLVMHQLQTPNFSTLLCYDRICGEIGNTLTACTENEAHRYARFLLACLSTINRWHSSKEIYDKECYPFPGFLVAFRSKGPKETSADRLEFDRFRTVCYKWHYKLTKSFATCLDSGSYATIRNALIVLIKILPEYPKIAQFGKPLSNRVDKLKQNENEKRPDLYALAVGYAGQLERKKASLIDEAEFHNAQLSDANPAKPSGTNLSNGSRESETPSREQARSGGAGSSGASPASAATKAVSSSASSGKQAASSAQPIATIVAGVVQSPVAEVEQEHRGRKSAPADEKAAVTARPTEKDVEEKAPSKQHDSKDAKRRRLEQQNNNPGPTDSSRDEANERPPHSQANANSTSGSGVGNAGSGGAVQSTSAEQSLQSAVNSSTSRTPPPTRVAAASGESAGSSRDRSNKRPSRERAADEPDNAKRVRPSSDEERLDANAAPHSAASSGNSSAATSSSTARAHPSGHREHSASSNSRRIYVSEKAHDAAQARTAPVQQARSRASGALRGSRRS